ncbi:hypothetical protein BN14_10162 [Rhizoctonia solani AG-1 IB]|uniref:Elongin-C n=1 Tax=Thanatephorus cucumeris (strain AG1-IB / isolate 7/3/14) TaxID=1108050 RepID=M5CAE6_THACB|nr:hypothetical protein BN14_10162 [Rhizoctonia solani AG-1 IB]
MTDQEIVWVRITSEDGFSFLLDKRAVECSGTLRDMVDDSLGFTEAHSKTISLAYRYVSETEPEPEASLTIFVLILRVVTHNSHTALRDPPG